MWKRTDQVRDLEWFVPVSLVLAAELSLWWFAYLLGYAHPPKLIVSGAAVNLIFAVIVLAKVGAAIVRMFRRGEPEPLKQLVGRQMLPRIVLTVIALELIVMAASAFGALKSGIPNAVPFWLDVPLARTEHAVFGMQPWQISHQILGWATPWIDDVYATFVPLETAIYLIVLCAPPSEWKSKALLSIVLAWFVLGVIGAYLLSSAGPLFYDRVFGGETFAPLTRLIQQEAPLTSHVSQVLWEAHSLHREIMLNGISAMPSMHVAGALWIALVVRHTRLSPLGWSYFAMIFLGSVQLGWHYLSDGLAGTTGMIVLWQLSPKLLFRPKQLRFYERSLQHG